jgi:hypothetical protein
MISRRDLIFSGVPLALTALRTHPVRAEGKARTAVPLVVIVGRDNPMTNITISQLRSTFLGNVVQDEQGHRLTPVNLPPGAPDRVCFDRIVLSMSPEEIGRYWVDRRARGLGMPPRFFDSPLLIQKLVARLPRVISYARADQLIPEVRILRIDNKTAGDPLYPLQKCEA